MTAPLTSRMRALLEDVASRAGPDGWARYDRLDEIAPRVNGWQHAHHGSTWTSAYARKLVEDLRRSEMVCGARMFVPVAVRLTRRGLALVMPRPNVWDDVGLTLDFDPRRPTWERWCLVEVTTRELVSNYMGLDDVLALGRKVAAELREDMARWGVTS